MKTHTLREIVAILKESPLYETLSPMEKRTVIKGLAESYTFFDHCNGVDLVGYESNWAGIGSTNEWK